MDNTIDKSPFLSDDGRSVKKSKTMKESLYAFFRLKLPMRPSNALERLTFYNKNTVKNFKTEFFVNLLSPLYDNYRKDWY